MEPAKELDILRKLKQWKSAFLRNNGRHPRKEDISPEIGAMIREYRCIADLKTTGDQNTAEGAGSSGSGAEDSETGSDDVPGTPPNRLRDSSPVGTQNGLAEETTAKSNHSAVSKNRKRFANPFVRAGGKHSRVTGQGCHGQIPSVICQDTQPETRSNTSARTLCSQPSGHVQPAFTRQVPGLGAGHAGISAEGAPSAPAPEPEPGGGQPTAACTEAPCGLRKPPTSLWKAGGAFLSAGRASAAEYSVALGSVAGASDPSKGLKAVNESVAGRQLLEGGKNGDRLKRRILHLGDGCSSAGEGARAAPQPEGAVNFVRINLKRKHGHTCRKPPWGGSRRPGFLPRKSRAKPLPQAGDANGRQLDAPAATPEPTEPDGAYPRGGCAEPEGAEGPGALPEAEPSPQPVESCPRELRDALEDPSEENLLRVLRNKFGFQSFRPRQLEVVQRVLRGESALAVLPTGSGKSLCYQLPALLLPGMCLVISPLISLMRDQLEHLPSFLPGAMLSCDQSPQESRQVLQDVSRGNVKVLFSSPERLLGTALLTALEELGRLSLVCVDEAHCVAEWGHNFRPAYFRMGRVLRASAARDKHPLVAFTATATRATESAVCSVLGLGADQVVRDAPIKENIRLGVLECSGGINSKGYLHRLTSLMRGPFAGARCIVYCSFQYQAEELARSLYIAGVQAVSYHAGMSLDARKRMQEMFCLGKINVIVATVAFGMGLDMKVDAVVHASMPRSLEEYVQQIGRSGRDGKEARCALLLDPEVFLKLRSLAHADCACASSVELLLGKVFGGKRGVKPAYRLLPQEHTCSQVDMKKEVIGIVLSYMQEDSEDLIRILPDAHASVEARFFRTAPEELASKSPVVAAFLKAARRSTATGGRVAPMARLCQELDADPEEVLRSLQALADQRELSFQTKKPLAFAIQVMRAPADIPGMAERLAYRLRAAEEKAVERLDSCFCCFKAAISSKPSETKLLDRGAERLIRQSLARYFGEESSGHTTPYPAASSGEEAAGFRVCQPADPVALPLVRLPPTIRGDIHAVNRAGLGTNGRQELTVRAMARIFHGLPSPGCPVDRFKGCGFWGKYASSDFKELMEQIKAELESCKLQTEFENEREELIKRNRQVMAEIGMLHSIGARDDNRT